MATTNGILDQVAVARRAGGDAATILQAYIATNPTMALSHTPPTPKTPAPAHGAPAPGGSQAGRPASKPGEPMQMAGAVVDPTVGEYEIFRNGKDALAFFFYRHPVLDPNAEEGPFWFTIQDNRILAGASGAFTIYEDIPPDVIEAAQQRGVIMLVEFENQQPFRCTPCYLTADL